jgi:signal transduction histidine kinase
MTLLSKNRIASPIVIAALLLVLASLMYLQYQWSKQVSDAAQAQTDADLKKSILAWHLDLFRALAGAPSSMRVNAEPDDVQEREVYINRFLEWRARSINPPGIVSNLYIWNLEDEHRATMLRLDTQSRSFEPAPWPERFEALRERLWRNSSALSIAIAGASSPEEFFAEHPRKDRPFEVAGNSDDTLGGWIFVPEIPALFHPIAHFSPPGAEKHRGARADWLVIEYDGDILRKQILPVLAQRYFAGRRDLEYNVAVVVGADQQSTIYASEGLAGTMKGPDASLNIFGPASVSSLFAASSSALENSPVAQDLSFNARQPVELHGAFWFPVIHTTSSDADWYVLVKHRRDLNAIFAGLRRRDLAVSFGIVFLLVISMALVLLASRRAQELAKLQVDFVTGVSHDLRTPLAIIGLAADNLADGVVDGREAVRAYGKRMQVEVRQLGERMEQVLSFASLNRRRRPSNIAPVEVKLVIDAALRNTSALLQKEGFAAEVTIEEGLNPLAGDEIVVSEALQNLITNAVKYGGEDHWIGIGASQRDGKHGAEIRISVEDHGIGIHKNELKSVFEPFYRSANVVAKRIRGTGLGLTLAQHTIEALGGSISVSSVPNQGSTFVIHLPAATRPTPEPVAEVAAYS